MDLCLLPLQPYPCVRAWALSGGFHFGDMRSELSVWLDSDDDQASFKRNTIRLFSKGGKSPQRVIARMGLKEIFGVKCCPGLKRD